MRAQTESILRTGVVVAGVLSILASLAFAGRDTRTRALETKIADINAHPCANAALDNRAYLIHCMSLSLAVLNENPHLRRVHAKDLAEIDAWTSALEKGRMQESAYMDGAYKLVSAMHKTAQTTQFSGADSMEWALRDLKRVLAFRKAGEKAVMSQKLAIAQ